MRDETLVPLAKALEGAGYLALAVGGAVRNPLMGRGASDIDLATDALPEVVSDLAIGAGLRVIPTGIEHGTVTVLGEGEPVEVTTFRKDVETDGRHAEVAFGADLAEDAARRDFTLNAIYADPSGVVFDPLGGIADLREGIVRFVGDADRRVQEDYLRILRFFRFTAQFGNPEHGIEPEGLSACATFSSEIETISAERIGMEMLKLLAAEEPELAVAAMQQCGILHAILPGADTAAFFRLSGITDRADPIQRLAALGGEGVSKRLRLSRAQTRRLESLRKAIEAASGPGELGYRLGAEEALAVMELRAALFEAPFDRAVTKQVAVGAGATCPVAAADLSKTLHGKAIGDALRAAEAFWIASGFTLGKEEILERLPRGD
ncbi:CCA tRNA nucleotidyltransferase [Alphaproteobacteria bacterium KMM 3653]|uniref:CCA tRNA nucleotidyltransferase n=2 Tax=Harenicola maris TaxID=2841044 RepID=A0AAP2G8M9_9RHOB|nr:CCA tRNA nucleotidyltransferase [Harenicola maris]